MAKLYKGFNYIFYNNRILFLDKNIFTVNYFSIIISNSNLKTLRLNFNFKSILQKYGLRTLFYKHLNIYSLSLNHILKHQSFAILYTKNILKFIIFFKKIFPFFLQQEDFLFRYPIYVKLTNNLFTYKYFNRFLSSFTYIS
jgi:hypothetical protein